MGNAPRYIGMSPSGKAPDFDSGIRRFKSGHPSQDDPLAQLAEQLPFKQWVRSSNLRRVTKREQCRFALLSFSISDRMCGTFTGRRDRLQRAYESEPERMIPVKLKKWIPVVLISLLLTAALTGCGSVKAAWVAARFGAALKANPVTAVSGTVTGSAAGTVLGVGVNSQLQLDFTSRIQGDTEKTYTDLRAGLNLWGAKLYQDLELFSQPKDGKTEYYVHLEKPDLWAKSSTTWDSTMLWKLDPAMLLLLAEGGADTAQMSASEAYYDLKLTIGTGEILKILSEVGANLSPKINDLELDTIRIPVELRISRESFLPVSLRLELQGLSGPLLMEILKEAGMEKSGVEITGGTLQLTLNSFAYGPQEIPPLPENAAAGAARMEEVFRILRKLMK